jgi:hypothetical protein
MRDFLSAPIEMILHFLQRLTHPPGERKFISKATWIGEASSDESMRGGERLSCGTEPAIESYEFRQLCFNLHYSLAAFFRMDTMRMEGKEDG